MQFRRDETEDLIKSSIQKRGNGKVGVTSGLVWTFIFEKNSGRKYNRMGAPTLKTFSSLAQREQVIQWMLWVTSRTLYHIRVIYNQLREWITGRYQEWSNV